MRALLRTIGRLFDEASTPNIHRDLPYSDERTNRELHAVLNALDPPADRRAFDINIEVQALVTSDDFETNDLARERLRYLRDVLNSKDLKYCRRDNVSRTNAPAGRRTAQPMAIFVLRYCNRPPV